MIDHLERISGRWIGLLVVLFIAATVLLLVAPFSLGRQLQELTRMPLPDWVGSAIGRRLPDFLNALGEDGRRRYILFLVLDCGYAALFGLTFGAAIAAARTRYERVPRELRRLALIPIAAAGLDLFENLGLIVLTLRHPLGAGPLTNIVGGASSVKIALTNMIAILGAIALFGLAHHGMRAAERS